MECDWLNSSKGHSWAERKEQACIWVLFWGGGGGVLWIFIKTDRTNSEVWPAFGGWGVGCLSGKTILCVILEYMLQWLIQCWGWAVCLHKRGIAYVVLFALHAVIKRHKLNGRNVEVKKAVSKQEIGPGGGGGGGRGGGAPRGGRWCCLFDACPYELRFICRCQTWPCQISF